MNTKIDYYNPIEQLSYDSTHTLLYTFQYGDAMAELVTTTSGNVAGGATMITEFDCGFSVPAEHELTKKHAVFFTDEDEGLPYREVGRLIFYYPNGNSIEISLEDCQDLLVSIQIIQFVS